MTAAEKKGAEEVGGFNMEVKLLENDKEKNKISFVIKGINPQIANLLRRNMIEDVPVMAVEEVEFRKNNSILYDEIIAHRLGLIPFTTDLKSYTLPEKCKCKGEGCARCTLKMVLKAKGPGTVYASEIKTKDPKVKPVFPKTPIVKLLKNQELELESIMILGKGKEHTKWSPCLCYYKYKPFIELTKNPSNPEELVKSCPVDIFELKNDKVVVNKDNMLKCHLCKACVDTSDAVKLTENDDEFVFYIESWGQLSPKEIAIESLNMFQEQLQCFEKELKK